VGGTNPTGLTKEDAKGGKKLDLIIFLIFNLDR
jgi:hypothetical protein